MEFNFKGRVAIVTGGGAGMGKAALLGFARGGASVVIADISEENMKETVAEVKALGAKALAVKCDITSNADIKNVVAKTLKEFGRIDILFNYAGGNPGGKKMELFIEETEEYWDRMIAINLKGTMIFCRAVIDTMMKQRYGKIINTAAIAGKIGSPRMVAYSTVKGGIIAFTKALAQELGEYNINVNAVSPGPVVTPGFKKIFGEQAAKGGSGMMMMPMRRMGQPEDVGNAAIFLASDEASYITGQTLAVDGGMTMVS